MVISYPSAKSSTRKHPFTNWTAAPQMCQPFGPSRSSSLPRSSWGGATSNLKRWNLQRAYMFVRSIAYHFRWQLHSAPFQAGFKMFQKWHGNWSTGSHVAHHPSAIRRTTPFTPGGWIDLIQLAIVECHPNGLSLLADAPNISRSAAGWS